MVMVLLEHGADLSAKGTCGLTPESFAEICPRLGTVAMLRAEPARREALRRAKCVAFAMGQHERLGAESRVQEIEAGVVRMVLEQV